LLALTDLAIRDGTAGMKPELETLYDAAWKHATADERRYLPVIRQRIGHGSLAELMRDRYKKEAEFLPLLSDMATSLQKNQPYVQG
jgi:hypothetical protein